jgi:hypothetical protein
LTQFGDSFDSGTTTTTTTFDRVPRSFKSNRPLPPNLLSTAGHSQKFTSHSLLSSPGQNDIDRDLFARSTTTHLRLEYTTHSSIMSSNRFMAVRAAAPAQTGAAAAAAKALQANAAIFNQDFYDYLFIICGSLVAALLVWRVGIESVKYVRTLTCLNNDTQRYFTLPSEGFANFKKHVLYAPIFRKRHNREFQLSAAMNVGTLPTRLQLLFLMS